MMVIMFICHGVATCDLVHDVKTVYGLYYM